MFEAHFQTFEEPEGGVALTARLAALREELARRQLSGFVIPRADQQQNEYVAPSEERLAWLTGFTGSAGLAIVLPKQAAVFVDGRYTLQAAKQVDTQAWTIASLVDPPPESWLTAHLVSGDRLGFDPWLHSAAAVQTLKAELAAVGIEAVALNANPIDAVWNDRPAPPAAATPEWYAEHNVTITPTSPHAVTVPGAVAAWDLLVREHGTRPLGELLQPAEEIGTVASLRDRTPVVAPHGGVIVEWLVEDGDLVSPGQPLIRLHPEGVPA